MRIFITGGNGQVGRALAGAFMDDELYLGKHESENIAEPKIIQTIQNFKPDMVIHTAAMTDVDACELKPDLAFLMNEQGTKYVAEAAQRTGAMMLYVSTDYVFDGSKNAPYLETDPTNPINVYGQSKLAGERAAREGVDRWLIIRTSWVYGHGQKNFVASVLEWVNTQPVLRLVKNKVGSPTYALDLAKAIKDLIKKKAKNRIYHVSGEGDCNWEEYGREILKITGIEKKIVPINFEDLKLSAKRPSYTVLNNEELSKTGFTMRPWRIALGEFLGHLVLNEKNV